VDPLLNRLAIAGGSAWKPPRSAILDAIGIVTTRIAALGVSDALRSRTPTETVRSSPLYRLTRAGVPEIPALIAASRDHLEHVRTALEDRGVSIDVVCTRSTRSNAAWPGSSCCCRSSVRRAISRATRSAP
jgi:site-specific recombinase